MKGPSQCISQNICNTSIKLVVFICNRVDGKRHLHRPNGFNLAYFIIIIIVLLLLYYYYRIRSSIIMLLLFIRM